jgi:hypothetical protein
MGPGGPSSKNSHSQAAKGRAERFEGSIVGGRSSSGGGGGHVEPEGPHGVKFKFTPRRKAGALPCARTHTGLSPPSTPVGVDSEQHTSIPAKRSTRDQEAEARPSFPAGEAIVVSVRCPTNTNTQESNPLRDRKLVLDSSRLEGLESTAITCVESPNSHGSSQ